MSHHFSEVDNQLHFTQDDQLGVHFDEELRYAEFILTKNSKKVKLARVRRPLLLWDQVRLERSRNYKLIASLFGRNTTIEYDNISIRWIEGVWPPSIDSLQFMRALRHSDFFNRPLRSVIDLGCGTGVLGIYFAKNNQHVKQLYLVDTSPRAIELSKYNVSLNALKIDIHYRVGNSYSALPAGCIADLILCTPPYVPKDDLPKSAYDPVAGTRLLVDAVLRVRQYCKGELIILYSSVAREEVALAKEEAGLTGFIMMKKKTPFRVPEVLNDSAWQKKLVDNGKLIHDPSAPKGYPYWHTIVLERIPCR